MNIDESPFTMDVLSVHRTLTTIHIYIYSVHNNKNTGNMVLHLQALADEKKTFNTIIGYDDEEQLCA